MPLRLVVLCLLLSVFCGCEGSKVTQIVVRIDSDLEVPDELAAVRFEARRSHQAAAINELWVLGSMSGSGNVEATLPLTVGLFPNSGSDDPVLITVTGLDEKNRGNIVRQARLPFVEGRRLFLELNLLRSCLLVSCQEKDETCIDGECKSIDVENPKQLPDPRFVDASVAPPLETSSPYEAGPEAGLDAGVDAGVDADGPVVDAAPDLPQIDGPKPDAPPDALKPDKPLPADAPPDKKPGPDQTPWPDTKPWTDSVPWPDLVAPCSNNPSCPGGWCTIPAGTFWMGSNTSEVCRDPDELQHLVTLTRCFEMQRHEVTQQDFQAKMLYNPSANGTCPTCPVENLTWDEAASYCNKLSEEATLTKCYSCSGAPVKCSVPAKYNTDQPGSSIYDCPGYRLPTEAEWEHAARAGEEKALYSGHDIPAGNCDTCDSNVAKIAWYTCNSSNKTHAVGQKTPNAWGLHDMAGNVAEWTTDMWYGPHWPGQHQTDPFLPPDMSKQPNRLMGLRGGKYNGLPRWTRSANRSSIENDKPKGHNGLRCVRSLTGTTP